MVAAHLCGIRVFVTGGIGGVHRGAESSNYCIVLYLNIVSIHLYLYIKGDYSSGVQSLLGARGQRGPYMPS